MRVGYYCACGGGILVEQIGTESLTTLLIETFKARHWGAGHWEVTREQAREIARESGDGDVFDE